MRSRRQWTNLVGHGTLASVMGLASHFAHGQVQPAAPPPAPPATATATPAATATPPATDPATSALQPAGTPADPVALAIATMQDVSVSPEQRGAAIAVLLASDSAGAKEAICAVLSRAWAASAPVLAAGEGSPTVASPPAPDPVGAAVLRQIAQSWSAPGWLVEPLAGAAEAAPPERQEEILAAMGSIRTRDAVEALLKQSLMPRCEHCRIAAITALRRLTGQTEISNDPRDWEAWFAGFRFAPDALWQRELADGLARRSDQLAASLNATAERLVELLRRSYLDAPEAQRPARLVALLGDDLAAARRLGIEMANRELANAHVPDETAVWAIIKLLRDPVTAIRSDAASLLGRIAPPEAGQALADALLTETDPYAAAAIMRAAVRWPLPVLRSPTMAWLKHGPATRDAARELGKAILAADAVTDPVEKAGLRDAVDEAK